MDAITQPTKYCSRGKHTLARTEFNTHMTKKDGLQDWCKACVRAYQQSRAEAKKAAEPA